MNRGWALPIDLPGLSSVPPALTLSQTSKQIRMQSIVWWGWFGMNWNVWNIIRVSSRNLGQRVGDVKSWAPNRSNGSWLNYGEVHPC